LRRLHDAIEAGVAELDDPAPKERIVSLKAIYGCGRLPRWPCTTSPGDERHGRGE
jgi:hypothetical protein